MSLNKSIIKIRVELQNTKLKKSGQNKFAGFSYYELSDFLPTLNKLMQDEGVNDIVTIDSDYATLKLIKDKEENIYTIPYTQFMTPTNKNGQPSMQDIQYLGALNTYYKRYLYLNAFGITDGEVIDAMDNSEYKAPPPSKATADDKKVVWDNFTSICQTMGVEAMEFLGQHIDMSDKKAVYAETRKWLANEQLLKDQLMIFKNG